MIDAAKLSADEVITNVRQRVGDEGAPHMRSRGYYIGHMRRALIDLSYDNLFDKKNFDAAIPSSLVVTLPEGLSDVSHLWLYNGDKCDFTNVKNLYWHVNFTRYGEGNYFAENRGFNDDPIIEDSLSGDGGAGQIGRIGGILYSFGIQNNKLMLSSSCAGFERIHMLYSGLGSVNGTDPQVPAMLAKAVEDYMTLQFYRFKQGRDKDARVDVEDAKRDYYGIRPHTGSRHEARRLVRRLLSKQARDLSKYHTSIAPGL